MSESRFFRIGKEESDARFFRIGKVEELRAELASEKFDPKYQRKKTVMKKIVANMTMGNDMSPLFPDVLEAMQVPSLEIKKMVYLYLVNYARAWPNQANKALPMFMKDVDDANPLIRALAIRTMGYILVEGVFMDTLIEALRSCLRDQDPYVRKTAAMCVAKLHDEDPEVVESENFRGALIALLSDPNPTVTAHAVVALTEMAERTSGVQMRLDQPIAHKLVTVLGECSEWCQTYILDALSYYVPESHEDAKALSDRIIPRLQHSNAAVVLSCVKMILYLMNYMKDEDTIMYCSRKLGPPLVTLMAASYEVQYVALRNILLIVLRRPNVLQRDIRVFFCKYDDPIYVKMAKLEVMFALANEDNASELLGELKEYAAEVDVDFSRKAVRSIGRLAIKVNTSTESCVQALLELINTRVNYVVQEATIVIKDIFRKYPNRYESIISVLCDNLDDLEEPEAKAAMIWIIGHYADRIENAKELLEDFLETFLEEAKEVQLALLTATVKLFIKRPTVAQALIPKVLKWATEEVGNPDLRDRGYIYWRLLSTDPTAAKAIVLTDGPVLVTDQDTADPAFLDHLLLHIATVASVHHRDPTTFIHNYKPRHLLPLATPTVHSIL